MSSSAKERARRTEANRDVPRPARRIERRANETTESYIDRYLANLYVRSVKAVRRGT